MSLKKRNKLKARFPKVKDNGADMFNRLRENFENIIEAAILNKHYREKSAAFQLLGADYETVRTHLESTVESYNPRKLYFIKRIVHICDNDVSTMESYHFKNLKLEE